MLHSDPIPQEEYEQFIDQLRGQIGHHENLELGYEDFVPDGG
jgi:hypothetical protein